MGKHDNVKYRLILDTKNTSQKVKCNPLDKSYKTIINHFTTLPLWIKRRRFLSPDINIVQFEYKCDMPISYFGLSIRFNMLKIRVLMPLIHGRNVRLIFLRIKNC